MDARTTSARTHDLPETTGWVLRFDVDTNRHVIESLTAVSDGRFGTRGLPIYLPTLDQVGPSTVAGGVFDDDEVPALLPGPAWNAVRVDTGSIEAETATLDLLRGVLTSAITGPRGTVVSTMFASVARPGSCGLQLAGPIDALDSTAPVLIAPVGTSVAIGRPAPDTMTVTSRRGVIAATGAQTVRDHAGLRTITRLVALAADTATAAPEDIVSRSRHRSDADHAIGFDELLAEHEAAWAERWQPNVVEIPADPDLQRAFRFAQFHLLSSSHDGDEAAIGARGLTGPAYRGHVFWDSDVFVVPALAAMAPPLARAALGYRANRLAAAKRRAIGEGRAGARFPWESAHDGNESAPTEGRDLHGNTVPIRTGRLEEHIVADVAWAFSTYLDWTGDTGFFSRSGSAVLIETARYWQSRVERDADGTAHIRGVIGPDEYHEDIDDNAFTNTMAAWNLRRSAELCERESLASPAESAGWRDTAERLVTGYAPDRGVHEQHAGFFDLEPVLAASLGTPPISAGALLGHDRLQQTQVIKQPDVLMAHHLIPDQLPPGTLAADLEYYLPRTSHGSSLSPAITASLLARVGRVDEAIRLWTMAARFDLDDVSGTTAGGLHLATMGGLWQAFTNGFFGIRAGAAALLIDPRIPDVWGTVIHRFLYRGAQVRVQASPDTCTVTASQPIDLLIGGQTHSRCRALTADRTTDGWTPQ